MTKYDSVDWVALTEELKAREPAAMQLLYDIFNRGIRYYVFKQLGPDLVEDVVNDCWIVILENISKLQEPTRLAGYMRTMVRRRVFQEIEDRVKDRARRIDSEAREQEFTAAYSSKAPSPLDLAIQSQIAGIMQKALASLSAKDRQIIEKFYFEELEAGDIQKLLGMSETQFRLVKSRAKRKFGKAGAALVATGKIPPKYRSKGRPRKNAT